MLHLSAHHLLARLTIFLIFWSSSEAAWTSSLPENTLFILFSVINVLIKSLFVGTIRYDNNCIALVRSFKL